MLQKIVVPDYPDSIQMSKERRAVYYTKNGKRKIPKRYLDKTRYYFDSNGRVRHTYTHTPVIANPRTVGKERRWVVNFQEIWNGRTAGPARANKINRLKDILRPYIKQMSSVKEYPIGLQIELYNTSFNVDAFNKGAIYIKVIEDLMTEQGIIEDDSPGYINDTGRVILHEVKTEDEKRMEIIIFKSSF